MPVVLSSYLWKPLVSSQPLRSSYPTVPGFTLIVSLPAFSSCSEPYVFPLYETVPIVCLAVTVSAIVLVSVTVLAVST